jgi:hypothetical protein
MSPKFRIKKVPLLRLKAVGNTYCWSVCPFFHIPNMSSLCNFLGHHFAYLKFLACLETLDLMILFSTVLWKQPILHFQLFVVLSVGPLLPFEDFTSILEYKRKYKMTISSTKTNSMAMWGNRIQRVKIVINGNIIEQVTDSKYLG